MNAGNTGRSFRWGYLIIGILFMIVSLICFWNPAGSLGGLAAVFGVLAIFNGVWLIANRMGTTIRLVAGIIDILIGIFFIVNIWAAAAALPYIFAIWFILGSVFRLMTVGLTKIMGAGYFIMSIIINIIGIILGIILLFNPAAAALTLAFLVGFYLMLEGIECIVLSFSK